MPFVHDEALRYGALTDEVENDEATTSLEDSESESEVLGDADIVQLGDFSRKPGDGMPKREEVEPYLAALLQAEHLSLLIGSGLTTALAKLAEFDGGADMDAQLSLANEESATAIEKAAQSSARRMGRGCPNIEDRLRVAIATAEGLKYIEDARANDLQSGIDAALTDLVHAVSSTEAALDGSRDIVAAGDMTLQGVLMTFLGAFAGRVPTRDRLHVFTTNYDRVIEWGAELAGLRIVDRFVGTLRPVFRSSRLEIDYHYSPPGSVRDPRHLDGVFRLTKLHGSLDWEWEPQRRRVVRSSLPFGQAPSATASSALIYPNASKDVETAFHPYADLFRDMAAALCRPHSVLVTYGYSFGDDHINRIIKDMLTIPSTHLLIISWDDASGRIRAFSEDHRRTGQVSLLVGQEMAGLPSLVERWLPWPSAEFLLQRRAQLFRERDTGSTRREPSEGSSA